MVKMTVEDRRKERRKERKKETPVPPSSLPITRSTTHSPRLAQRRLHVHRIQQAVLLQQRTLAALLKVDAVEVEVAFGGYDHYVWHRAVASSARQRWWTNGTDRWMSATERTRNKKVKREGEKDDSPTQPNYSPHIPPSSPTSTLRSPHAPSRQGEKRKIALGLPHLG